MRHFYLSFFMILMSTPAFTQKENNSLDSLMSLKYQKDLPGAAIAVIKDGEIAFQKGYGIMDMISKRPVTLTTNFNICSLTKQFTAYSILKLADEKKLSLDDKLDKYFPGFSSRPGSSITIRNLLTHSSGIIDHYDFVDKTKFKEFVDKDVLTVIKSVDSVYFPAGTQYRYSNTAFCLLSLIIEHVSGNSYPEYIRNNIFKPLAMDKSEVLTHDINIPERAMGYEIENGNINISDAKESLFFSTMGDGGIYTSMNEYLKWILAIQSGKVLSKTILNEAQSSQFTIDKAKNISYGFGWFVAGSDSNKIVFHTGSNGGFRTMIFMIPSKKYSVVVFSNRTGIDLEDLVHEINKIFKIDDRSYVKLESLIS